MIKKYFKNLHQTAETGDAREESFYPDLKSKQELFVPSKRLKDRRERDKGLSPSEIKHYCKVVTALQKTIEIQEKIDTTEIYTHMSKGKLAEIRNPLEGFLSLKMVNRW